MKKTLMVVLGVSIFLVLGIGSLNDPAEVSAISGCCKQRDSYKEDWYRDEFSFKECQLENRQDRDNIFKPAGLFWWDRACR